MYNEVEKPGGTNAVCLPQKQKKRKNIDHNKELGPRRGKSTSILFLSIVAGTKYKTMGKDHMVFNATQMMNDVMTSVT